VGGGPSEVRRRLDWDDPELSRVVAGVDAPPRLAAALAGCDIAVAFTRSAEVLAALGRLLPRVVAVDPRPPAGSGHASRWLASACAELAPEPSEVVPPLLFSDDEQAEARRRTEGLGAGFIAVHPGSGSPAKNWPFVRFVDLARRLAARRPWLLALGPAEETLAAPSDAVVARGWPIRVLGAALARAGVVVGNDSGASHLAAAAGAPTVALFGPTDPDVWSPVGPRVTVVRAPGGDLSALDVETVLERIRDAHSSS
jgi:ADP-heptose:LPS heptosyltransferase